MAAIATDTQPSYYYMLIAQTCLHRSRATAGDHVRAHALREAAGHYMDKARLDHRAPADRRTD